jgi:hypothetical protein
MARWERMLKHPPCPDSRAGDKPSASFARATNRWRLRSVNVRFRSSRRQRCRSNRGAKDVGVEEEEDASNLAGEEQGETREFLGRETFSAPLSLEDF